jgi:hypothetical protein
LILTFSASVGCSTVHTVPIPAVQKPADDGQQKAILDFNASADGKKATLHHWPTRVTSLTAEQSTALVGKRVRYRTDGEEKAIWVTRVDYPFVMGTSQKRRPTMRSGAGRGYGIQFDLRDLQVIEFDESRMDVTSVKIVADSISWYSAAGESQQVPWLEVETVTLKSRGRGAFDGLKMGALIGLFVGAPFGPLGAAGGVLWGVVLGPAIGFAAGHKHVYRFEPGREVQE